MAIANAAIRLTCESYVTTVITGNEEQMSGSVELRAFSCHGKAAAVETCRRPVDAALEIWKSPRCRTFPNCTYSANHSSHAISAVAYKMLAHDLGAMYNAAVRAGRCSGERSQRVHQRPTAIFVENYDVQRA